MSFAVIQETVRAARRHASRLSTAALEQVVRRAAARGPGTFATSAAPAAPRSIFVLRNNDIGDLLAVTPLFAALRRRFPEAWIGAGVGSWNLPVLEHNPHLSEVLPINAPWHNKYLRRAGTAGRALYLRRSPEVRALASRRFEVGIDVLGSGWGSLLMLRAGIPYRLGVRGFAGGESAVQAAVLHDPREHVGRAALRFAEILGAAWEPPIRPQIFLRAAEVAAAERWWASSSDGSGRERGSGDDGGGGGQRRARLVLGPGGGLTAKCWPAESFLALARSLAGCRRLSLLALGGERERDLVAAVAAAARGRSLPDPPGLRELFALVAASDLVVCNSSMLLHVAAAFAKPTLVLLGPAFPSATLHQMQWGYAATCRSLGREPGGRGLASAAEALAAVHELLAPWKGTAS
jgi:ADP-heptose:LPS heptosyltransferase